MSDSANISVAEFATDGEDVFVLRWLTAWLSGNWYWFLLSGLVHAIGFLVAAIVSVLLPMAFPHLDDAPSFDHVNVEALRDDPGLFNLGNAPLEPSELSTDSLTQLNDTGGQSAKYYDDSDTFEQAGGGVPVTKAGLQLGGFGFRGDAEDGPGGRGGVGVGTGLGTHFGVGGDEEGIGGRGTGHREKIGAFGGTKATERAVGAALSWFQRHQNVNGSWSLQHTPRCRGERCTGTGSVSADAAATGMALLPYLAAGQTHLSKGPYQQTINRGLIWMVKHQKADGNLASGTPQPMYSHALATIALCEAYALSKDETLRNPAQKAVRYIEMAQNRSTGGWRYIPGDTGDTSVVGWQVMALESAQMAHLAVDTAALENVRRWLKSVSRGSYGGLYSYLPHRDATPTTTAIGMLCQQYLGARRDDPAMQEGLDYLLSNLPDANVERNTYYWYYGTLVMHNLMGPDWDRWNRRMRRVLIESQAKEGCAMGSWDPEHPNLDTWGGQGGRVMTTSFATLSLEVYYRYLPLFQIESSPGERSSQRDEHMAMRPQEK